MVGRQTAQLNPGKRVPRERCRLEPQFVEQFDRITGKRRNVIAGVRLIRLPMSAACQAEDAKSIREHPCNRIEEVRRVGVAGKEYERRPGSAPIQKLQPNPLNDEKPSRWIMQSGHETSASLLRGPIIIDRLAPQDRDRRLDSLRWRGRTLRNSRWHDTLCRTKLGPGAENLSGQRNRSS